MNQLIYHGFGTYRNVDLGVRKQECLQDIWKPSPSKKCAHIRLDARWTDGGEGGNQLRSWFSSV